MTSPPANWWLVHQPSDEVKSGLKARAIWWGSEWTQSTSHLMRLEVDSQDKTVVQGLNPHRRGWPRVKLEEAPMARLPPRVYVFICVCLFVFVCVCACVSVHLLGVLISSTAYTKQRPANTSRDGSAAITCDLLMGLPKEESQLI